MCVYAVEILPVDLQGSRGVKAPGFILSRAGSQSRVHRDGGVTKACLYFTLWKYYILSRGRRRLIRGLLYLCLHEAVPPQLAPRSLLLRLFVMHHRIFGSPHMLRRSYFGRFVGPHSEKSWDVWLTQIGYESWKCGERGVGDSKRRKERGQKSRFHILKSIIRPWD